MATIFETTSKLQFGDVKTSCLVDTSYDESNLIASNGVKLVTSKALHDALENIKLSANTTSNEVQIVLKNDLLEGNKSIGGVLSIGAATEETAGIVTPEMLDQFKSCAEFNEWLSAGIEESDYDTLSSFKAMTGIKSTNEENLIQSKNVFFYDSGSIRDADKVGAGGDKEGFAGICPNQNLVYFGSEFWNESLSGNDDDRTYKYSDERKYDFEEFSGATLVAGTKAHVGPYGASSVAMGNGSNMNARGHVAFGYETRSEGPYWRNCSKITANANNTYTIEFNDYSQPLSVSDVMYGGFATLGNVEFKKLSATYYPNMINDPKNCFSYVKSNGTTQWGKRIETTALPKLNTPWVFRNEEGKLSGSFEQPTGNVSNVVHLPEREKYYYILSDKDINGTEINDVDYINSIILFRVAKNMNTDLSSVQYAFSPEYACKYGLTGGRRIHNYAPHAIAIGANEIVGAKAANSITIGNNIINNDRNSIVIAANAVKQENTTFDDCRFTTSNGSNTVTIDAGDKTDNALNKIFIRNESLQTILNATLERANQYTQEQIQVQIKNALERLY